MSIKVTTAVWDSGLYAGNSLLVLLAMADWANDEGASVFPSVARLAAKARISERAVQYILRTLEADGLIECTGNPAGGRGRTRIYRINLIALQRAQGTCTLSDTETVQDGCTLSKPKGCKSEHERVQDGARKGAIAVAPEPSVEPLEEEPLEREDPSQTGLLDIPDFLNRSPEGQAFNLYNEVAREIDLPRAQVLDDRRRRSLRARLKEIGGIDGWRIALEKLRKSSYLRNGKGTWRGADLEFLLQPKSMTRLMEGGYDDRPSGSNSPAQRAADETKRRRAGLAAALVAGR